jgi:hypothetical protein
MATDFGGRADWRNVRQSAGVGSKLREFRVGTKPKRAECPNPHSALAHPSSVKTSVLRASRLLCLLSIERLVLL